MIKIVTIIQQTDNSEEGPGIRYSNFGHGDNATDMEMEFSDQYTIRANELADNIAREMGSKEKRVNVPLTIIKKKKQ